MIGSFLFPYVVHQLCFVLYVFCIYPLFHEQYKCLLHDFFFLNPHQKVYGPGAPPLWENNKVICQRSLALHSSI